MPLYDAAQIAPALDALALVVGGYRTAAMRDATLGGMLTATDLADHLAQRGVPFREAHAVVGRLVAELTAAKRTLGELTLEELHRHHAAFEASALEEVGVERSLAARSSPGGTAPERVREAIAAAAKQLER